MRCKIRGLVLLTLAATLFAANATGTSEPVSHSSVHITTSYIDAKISLDYTGFEGLSVDSLGKERPVCHGEPMN